MFEIVSQPVLPADYHHPISPSQLKRIFKCSGSVEAVYKSEKQEVGPAAEFGRRVHETAYAIWQSGLKNIVSNDPATKVAVQYLQALSEIVGELDQGVMEHRLFLPHVKTTKFDPLSGTVDYAAVIPFERLLIVDLKTGYEDVQPEDNLQLMFYASACFYSLDAFSRAVIPRIDLVIVQINDKVGTEVKTHTVTEQELHAFVSKLKDLVWLVENEPYLDPGEHCHQTYCPARFTCPAYKKYVADNIGGEIIEIPQQELAEPINFAKWLEMIPAVEDKIEQIKKLALQAALDNPDLVPGWTVKQSFGHRKWEDEKEAVSNLEELIGEKAYRKEPISPAQAEKALGKERKACMPATVRPDLGYKLVKRTKDEIDKFLEGTDE
jgi:hypothetical protein